MARPQAEEQFRSNIVLDWIWNANKHPQPTKQQRRKRSIQQARKRVEDISSPIDARIAASSIAKESVFQIAKLEAQRIFCAFSGQREHASARGR